MQKITKGALASGGAALLLIGGGSTLALWSDTEAVNGGSITTGTVAVEAAESNSDFAIESLAPGGSEDSVQQYTVTLDGVDNATLEVQAPVATGTDADLTVVTTASYNGQSVPLTGGVGEVPITEGGELTVTTTVSLAEADEDLKSADVTVDEGSVTVTQVTETAEEQ